MLQPILGMNISFLRFDNPSSLRGPSMIGASRHLIDSYSCFDLSSDRKVQGRVQDGSTVISASQDATCLCFVHMCSKLELVCCQKHKNVDASSTLLFLVYIYDLLRQTFKETDYERKKQDSWYKRKKTARTMY